MVADRDAVRLDCCCTRVLSRSAGWRRMEEVRPEARPARKWNVVLDAVFVYIIYQSAIQNHIG